MRPVRRSRPPLFIIDSHPVDVCRTVRVHGENRLEGLARTGYCAALTRWFHGVREHLVFTPTGLIRTVVQIPGNRHDVQGLYALLKSSLRGLVLGDNAYTPRPEKARKLADVGIEVIAAQRSDAVERHPKLVRILLKDWRRRVERRIALFDEQFNASDTLCRSPQHYRARRWMKVLAHNLSRLLNSLNHLKRESVAHYRLAA